MTFEKQKKYKEAIEGYNKVYELLKSEDKKNKNLVLYNIASCYFKLRMFEDALEYLDKTKSLGDYLEDNIEELKTEIKRELRNLEEASEKANSMISNKDCITAVELLSEVIEIKETPDLFIQRGKAKYFLQEYTEAISDISIGLEQIEKIEPSNDKQLAEAFYYLGRSYLDTGDYKGAVKYLSRSVDNVNSLTYKAYLQLASKRLEVRIRAQFNRNVKNCRKSIKAEK